MGVVKTLRKTVRDLASHVTTELRDCARAFFEPISSTVFSGDLPLVIVAEWACIPHPSIFVSLPPMPHCLVTVLQKI